MPGVMKIGEFSWKIAIHMPMYVHDGSVNLFCSVECVHSLLSLFCTVFVFIFHVFSSSLPVPLRDCHMELH